MTIIEQANALVQFSLSADPNARITKVQEMAGADEDGNIPKGQIKRLNKLLMTVLTARDAIAVELQQELWNAVQLPLFSASGSDPSYQADDETEPF